MAKQEYEIVWKEGSFFEKGKYILQPKTDNSWVGLVYLIAIVLIVFLVILTIPIWCIVIALLSMVREKRYLASIFAIAAFAYFHFDIQKGWLTSFFDDNSETFKYIYYANNVAIGFAISFIVDAILISNYGKQNNDKTITLPQVAVYLFFPIITFLIVAFSGIPELNNNKENIDENQNETAIEEVYTPPAQEVATEDSINNNFIDDEVKETEYNDYVSDEYKESDSENMSSNGYYAETIELKSLIKKHLNLETPNLKDFPEFSETTKDINFTSKSTDYYGRTTHVGVDNDKNYMHLKRISSEGRNYEYEIINLNNNKTICFEMPLGREYTIGQYKSENNNLIQIGSFYSYSKEGKVEDKTFYPDDNKWGSHKRIFFRYFTDMSDSKVKTIDFYNEKGKSIYNASYRMDYIYDNNNNGPLDRCYFLENETEIKDNLEITTYFVSPCQIKFSRKNKENTNVINVRVFYDNKTKKNVKKENYDYESGKLSITY